MNTDLEFDFSEEIPMVSMNPSSEASCSKSNKKKLLKKAPQAPKRFKTAYICFVADKMEEVKYQMKQYEGYKVTDVLKVLSNMWRQLSPMEKRKYERMAELDKERYLNEISTYSGPLQVPNKRQKKDPVSHEHILFLNN